jgi:hypothetical protein
VNRGALMRDGGRAARGRHRCASPARRVVRRCPCQDTRCASSMRAAQELPRTRPGPDTVPRTVGDPGLLQEPVGERGPVRWRMVNTGDLGYFAAGELHLTGRAKEPSRAPRGQHPPRGTSKLRWRSCAAVRKGAVAVFPAADPHTGKRTPRGACRSSGGRWARARAAHGRDRASDSGPHWHAARRRCPGASGVGAEDLEWQG